MAAFAPVLTSSLLDPAAPLITTDAAIGVDKTWAPETINGQGVASWVDRSSTIVVGYARMTLQVRPPTKASRIWKVTCKVAIPTLEVTSPSTGSGIQPAPTKAYDCTCIMEWLLPERSTGAERNALFRHIKSLFLPTINASDGSPTNATGSPLLVAVKDLETVY
jgi:hypothetical protein